jgi:hypothetical protein
VLRRLREWLRLGSLDRGDHATEEEQPVENLDATAAAAEHGDILGPTSGYPSGYVKSYDEGSAEALGELALVH